MFLQVKGEGLNVGCVLTWGPCYDYQRRFFGPRPDGLSEPLTVLKYDVEVSGFGSQALGHVCLLNLRDQTLSRLGRDRDEGLADLDDARAALGEGAGGGHRLRPLGLGPGDRPEGRRQAAARPRSTATRTARSRRPRPRAACCPTDFAPADADSDGVADPLPSSKPPMSGPPRRCRTSRSPR